MSPGHGWGRPGPPIRLCSDPIPILMYHSVSEHPRGATWALSVRPSALDRQLEHLRRDGFTGLTFGDLCVRWRTNSPLPSRPVVLTFDDGYADLFETALPILLKHGFPATVFVTTGWLHDAGRYAMGAPLDRMMTWRQVEELPQAGVEVAAHSHSHAHLDQVSDTRLRSELGWSRSLLQDRLGVAVASVAYPYGHTSGRVRAAVREIGYQQAAAVANLPAPATDEPFRVPRLTIRRSTSLSVFVRIAARHRTSLHYAPDHVLSAGWSAVRGVRRLLHRSESESCEYPDIEVMG